MTIEQVIRAVAGSMILISVLGTLFISPNWIWLSGFVGLNLLQSSFTKFCLMEKLLKIKIR